MPNLNHMLQQAALVRDAKIVGENTANRVGALLVDIVNMLGQPASIDLSPYLPRIEFDDMFEWVTVGTQRYIKAKATVVSVGNLVALYKGDDVPTQSVGLDITALESYLTDNSYATQDWVLNQGFLTGLAGYATESWVNSQGFLKQHQNLANYVTLDTPQEITNTKYFTHQYPIFFKHHISGKGLYFDIQENGSVGLFAHTNGSWTASPFLFSNDGAFHAGSFIKSGGTASQFLKADGSVDSNTYLTSLPTRLSQYITSVLSDGNGFGRIASDSPFKTLVSANNNDCMLVTTGYSDAWRGELALDYRSNNIAYRNKNSGTWNDWALVLTNKNYASILDNSYVKKSGDTMSSGENPLVLNSNRTIGSYIRYNINGAHKATSGYYNGLAFVSNEVSYARIGVNDAGIPQYWSSYDGSAIHCLWHAGNMGSGSGLDADLLDGLHASSFYRTYNTLSSGTSGASDWMSKLPTTIGANSGHEGNVGNLAAWAVDTGQILLRDSNTAYFRTKHWSSGWGAWQQLARLTDNVASATRLQGTFSLWGQSFYGNDVSGDMTGVGKIGFTTAGLELNVTTDGYYFGTTGQAAAAFTGVGSLLVSDAWADKVYVPTNGIFSKGAIKTFDWLYTYGNNGWYNSTHGGGWWMKDSTYIRNYNNKRLLIEGVSSYDAVTILSGGGIKVEDSVGSSWNNGWAALNVGVKNNGAQTPLLMAYRYGVSFEGGYRLFAMELLNTGSQMNICFGGAHKFIMFSDGTLLANGNLTALSDVRAKSFITDLEWRGRLQPKRYWKDNRWQIGFIAQEVDPLYSEAVFKGSRPEDMWALDYNSLVAVVALQTNKNTDDIEELKSRVKTLEDENRQLKQLLRA